MSTLGSTTHTPDTDMENNNAFVSDVRVKVRSPDLYHGDREKLEEWLLQLNLYFRFGPRIAEKEKALLAASYLRGKAQKWIMPAMIKYTKEENDEGDDIDKLFEDFDNFQDKIKAVFGVINETPKAEQALQRLRQTHSASDSTAEFQAHATQTTWNEDTLKTMYKQGLKPKLRKELLRTGAATETLEDFCNEAIRIDNEFFGLAMELKGRHDYRRDDNRQPVYKSNTSKRRNNYYGTYATNGMEPIILGNTEKGQGKGKQPVRFNNKQRDKHGITCYAC